MNLVDFKEFLRKYKGKSVRQDYIKSSHIPKDTKVVYCDCNEKCSFTENISTGEYIYNCARSVMEHDKELGFYINIKAKLKPCKFKKTIILDSNRNLLHMRNVVKKKNIFKNITYLDEILYLECKINFFKTTKLCSIYQDIEIICKKYFIETFEENNINDLGDYCEYLINFCNGDIENYYNNLKHVFNNKIEVIKKIVKELEIKSEIFNDKKELYKNSYNLYIKTLTDEMDKTKHVSNISICSTTGHKRPTVRNKKKVIHSEEVIKIKNGPLLENMEKTNKEMIESYDSFYDTFDEFSEEYNSSKIQKNKNTFIISSNDMFESINKCFKKIINSLLEESCNNIKNINMFSAIIKQKKEKKYSYINRILINKLKSIEGNYSYIDHINNKIKQRRESRYRYINRVLINKLKSIKDKYNYIDNIFKKRRENKYSYITDVLIKKLKSIN